MNNSAKNNSIIYSGGIGGPANINNIIYNMPAVNANIIYNNKLKQIQYMHNKQ